MNYGLIGEHLAHSISPKIHALLGNKAYALKALPPQEVESYLKNGSWQGLNVTIPYKETVIPFCHSLSEKAIAIGAVNTLVKKEGRIHGDNTDYQGFLAMAKQAGISFAQKSVVIFGSGGTSKTAKAAVTAAHPKSLTVVSRREYPRYEDKEAYCHCDILINTTPLGMYPHTQESPCKLKDFSNLHGVLDVIYNPLETTLLRQAKMLKIPCANGLYMLIEQARYAEELFFDRSIPKEKTQEIYEILRNCL